MSKISKILVSQPEPHPRSHYFTIAEKHKLKIEFVPFIEIVSVTNKEFRKQRVDLNTFPAVIFTSRNSMDFYFKMMEEMRATISQETKYFCVSEAIALYLQKYIQYRKRKVFFSNGNFEDFKRLIKKHKNTGKFLVPCTDIRNDELANYLSQEEFNYTESVMYRAVNADLSEMAINDYDMIVFFSPTGVQSLLDNFPKYKQGNTLIAAYGSTTHEKIEELGLRLDLQAPTEQHRSMSMVIESYFDRN
ncbi:MAG: uroporphyrinogen-III synthase [Chitinophagales bacterium]|nr:uroporphyrinogen-III synthase [Bacteroidota bacterium]MCB9227297.1 uroporphyrinogen-III synthase [Chitinophagales bacterium]